MSASKRDFTDYTKFYGKVNNGTGIYEFPVLYHKDDYGHIRQWQMFIRLVKNNNRQSKIDWNLLQENQIEIKHEYYNSHDKYVNLPSNVIAEVWAETGVQDGKITRTTPTYFDTISMQGRKNQRNPFHQALIYGRSQFLKRKEKGGNLTMNQLLKEEKCTNKQTKQVMYFPMLATDYKNSEKYIQYPVYMQPKLDGVRCLCYLLKKDGGESSVVLYSRTQKTFPSVDHFKKVLYPYLNDLFDTTNNIHQSIYLDGELYKHGKTLQDISGDSRNSKVNNNAVLNNQFNDNNMNEYHIYDCFYPCETTISFKQRQKQLEEIFSTIIYNDDQDALQLIKQVTTVQASNKQQSQKQFNKFIKEGYEGAMLRNANGVYLANAHKTGAFMRSKDLIKLKKSFTNEFEVIDYTQGSRGKDKGALIWIAITSDTKKTFNVTPKNMTYDQRYALFKECQQSFDAIYKGRMLTVEYQDLSNTGVPLRAKALVFRDYE